MNSSGPHSDPTGSATRIHSSPRSYINQQDGKCSSSKEALTNASSLDRPEIPLPLYNYMVASGEASIRPTKRRKLNIEQNAPDDGSRVEGSNRGDVTQPSDFIVVRRTGWEVEYSKTGPPALEADTKRSAKKTKVGWIGDWQPSHLEVFGDETKSPMLRLQLSNEMENFQDIRLALLVDRDAKKWQGKLWTDFGLNLRLEEDIYVLQITLTIKWKLVFTPHDVHQATAKTPALLAVLRTYFPDADVNDAENWTPQDFYQAVHAPAKSDEFAAMDVPGLETSLFPFQKRAVGWLLRREGVEWTPEGVNVLSQQSSDLPNSFIQCVDADGLPCYVSHLFGVVTRNIAPFRAMEDGLKGGILSEEMGLGKTVELISLIILHKRKPQESPQIYDYYIGETVRSTAATLIIAPPSILQQWISEVNRHAPALKVMHYEGLKGHQDMEHQDIVNSMDRSDIVITTYAVLASEIHYTKLNGQKTLRRESKYPRPTSPLMQLSWYRVCIDEAQMIESGVSNSAIVARIIPRLHAWCVSGTPVRKNVSDLQGLLIFLRYHPFDNIKHVWSSLISSHKRSFRKLFGSLALRHSKRSVRDELKLPAQRRYVITMPFTPIEEQHYQELFNQMCEDCGLDAHGAPILENWEPDANSEIMRNWLVRLRQTALHPEVGGRNRRALGQKDGPLRTVDQVLEVMMEQADLAIRSDQRALLTSKLKRGQLYENSPQVQKALDIWTEAVDEAGEIVQECRQQLQVEVDKAIEAASDSREGSMEDNSDEQEEIDPTSRLGVFRNRLRGALEIEHMATFFQANAFYQIKTNEDLTKPHTPEYVRLEKLETEGYERAKQLRQEILQEIFRKADKLMKRVAKSAANQSFVQIPELPTSPPAGGIESRRIIEQLDTLAAALDAQANVLDEWRETTIGFLLRPLVDVDAEGAELTGEEYEESTKTQDEVMVYVQALRAVIADRHDALTGQVNQLIADEVKRAIRLAKTGEGAFPEKTIETLNTRKAAKPTQDMGSMRGIVAELRALVTILKTEMESGSVRAKNELFIVENQLSNTQKQLSEQIKANNSLEKEIELFTTVMNTRLEYYRQLQQVSDMVAPYEGPNNERVIARMLEDEEKMSRKVATSKSKRRYLDHLRKEASNPQEQRTCVICKETFDIGALTVCGHQYCKECIGLWWAQHRNCPVCKRKLLQVDLHEITYKPQELSIQAEEVPDPLQQRSSPTSKSRKASIYSEISKTKLAEIKNIELDGPSFTTKVDTLARHIIWLRESDPGSKSIIYSQFREFLDVLSRAFDRYRICYSSIDRPNGIERFKQDPGIECFLLHARAHSSGLNLVNASHVFLCEPLLNTALELQAIARVDRIGQHQETNVWLYLVDGTVEESIHQLSVKRRMEHIGQTLTNGKGKAREISADNLLDTKLEEANSMELQQATLTGMLAKGGRGGEMVHKEDLWECLFGGTGQKRNVVTLQSSRLNSDNVLGRELRAGAAEERAARSEQEP